MFILCIRYTMVYSGFYECNECRHVVTFLFHDCDKLWVQSVAAKRIGYWWLSFLVMEVRRQDKQLCAAKLIIYCCFQQWKNVQNLLTVDDVITKSLTPPFFCVVYLFFCLSITRFIVKIFVLSRDVAVEPPKNRQFGSHVLGRNFWIWTNVFKSGSLLNM